MVQLKAPLKTTNEVVVSFQFLMVQLKDLANANLENAYLVSIPYGSIKRVDPFDSRDFFPGFNSLWFN